MADDFVNNFGLLGQVLFKKRNEREARQRLDEALSRELAKIAAGAGYDKEIAEMRERGAKERTEIGETGANTRMDRQLSHAEKLAQQQREHALTQYILERAANAQEMGMKYDAEGNLLRTKAELENPFKTLQTSTDARNALAAALSSIAQFEDKVGPVNPELYQSLTGVRQGTAAGPVVAPTKGGRFSVSRPDGTPPTTKSGETSRTPNNAASEVPVQVGPKPLSSGVSIIGGDKATLQGGPDVTPPTLADLMKQTAPAQWPYNTLAVDVGQPHAAKHPSLYQQLRGALPEELSGLLPEKGVDALPIIKRDKAAELVERYLLNQPAIKK